MQEYVLIHGGRITKQVSGKTNFLIVGNELEDGRRVKEGSKFKNAFEKGIPIVHGLKAFNVLLKDIHEAEAKQSTTAKKANPYTTSSVKKNPYAKASNPYTASSMPSTNPYSKKISYSNPYANSSSCPANPYAKKSSTSPAKLKVDTTGALWADSHAPASSKEILGNGDAVKNSYMVGIMGK